MASNKLLNFLLLPAFVLAHVLCICGMATAQAHVVPAAVSHQRAEHDCCHEEGSGKAPEPAPHQHDPGCPHCGDQEGRVVVNERVKAPDVQLNLLAFQVLPSIVSYLLPDSTDARLQSFTPWLSDLSPPPDLLRVKCTLQI